MTDPRPDPGPPDPADPADAEAAARGLRAYLAKQAEQTAVWRRRAEALADRHRDRPLIDIGLRIYIRDRESAGSVLGSALAFRLFLFFVPLLLFLVGVAGFLHPYVDEGDVSDAGITGRLASQIGTALNQPNTTRWSAVVLGLFGMASAGRTLSKVMVQASCLTWRLPLSSKATVKVVGGVVGLIVGVGLVSFLVNRIRHSLGIGVTSASFLVALAAYAVVWLLLATLLPRATTDPGALLPGALLNAVVLAGLQAVSQLYLPSRFERASSLYGAVGSTVVILGWFFILGRTVILSMSLNAAVYERFGSISTFVFGLPVLRAIPRRWTWLRRYFKLVADDGPAPAGPARTGPGPDGRPRPVAGPGPVDPPPERPV